VGVQQRRWPGDRQRGAGVAPGRGAAAGGHANSHASKTDQANAILDWVVPNLSYFDSPLGIEELVDASTPPGLSAAIKLVIDAVANYGATAFCFQAAVAAKKG
jgi:hypothetical protein